MPSTLFSTLEVPVSQAEYDFERGRHKVVCLYVDGVFRPLLGADPGEAVLRLRGAGDGVGQIDVRAVFVRSDELGREIFGLDPNGEFAVRAPFHGNGGGAGKALRRAVSGEGRDVVVDHQNLALIVVLVRVADAGVAERLFQGALHCVVVSVLAERFDLIGIAAFQIADEIGVGIEGIEPRIEIVRIDDTGIHCGRGGVIRRSRPADPRVDGETGGLGVRSFELKIPVRNDLFIRLVLGVIRVVFLCFGVVACDSECAREAEKKRQEQDEEGLKSGSFCLFCCCHSSPFS